MEMSDEKLREIKEAFELYSQDGTQYVGMTQLRSVLLCLGLNLNSDEINSIMEEYGEYLDDNKENNNVIKTNSTNNSYKITSVPLKKLSYSNFLLLMSKRIKESDNEEELIEAFRSFDKTGDGKMGYEEIKYLLLCLGENFSEDEILEIINQTDTTGKGYVDYKDFIKILLVKNNN